MTDKPTHGVTSEMIRQFVDNHGWTLAKADPVIGPVIRKMQAEQRAYEDSIIEPYADSFGAVHDNR